MRGEAPFTFGVPVADVAYHEIKDLTTLEVSNLYHQRITNAIAEHERDSDSNCPGWPEFQESTLNGDTDSNYVKQDRSQSFSDKLSNYAELKGVYTDFARLKMCELAFAS